MTNLFITKKTLIVAAGVVLVAYLIGLMNPGSRLSKHILDFQLYDLYYASQDNNGLDTNIVLIEIGNDRAEIAEQINAISKGNPKVIGVDAFFENQRDSLGDLMLQAAIDQNQKIVLADRFVFDGDKEYVLPNVFAKGEADKCGYANLVAYSAQTVIRTYSPKIKRAEDTQLSFTSRIATHFDPEKFNRFAARNNDQEIINYRGDLNSYLNVSRNELHLLDSAGQLTDAFRNKIVLLGFFNKTPPLTMDDLHFSPLNKSVFGNRLQDMYGVAIHANILSMFLGENYANLAPGWLVYALAFVLVFVLNFYLRYQYRKKKRSPYRNFIIAHALTTLFISCLFFLVYKWFLLQFPLEPIILSLVLSTVYGTIFHRSQKLRYEKSILEVMVNQRTEELEASLQDLKKAQAQLVQKEKMASLGELTAGIAHEIQNPLNFVNNFSEISNDLMDEMKDELDKGDIEEAKAIAVDIKQNLEKINHHGKRADGIVKGMLQHSRNSGGEKEPTDINALADEYLRLSYQGIKAKDKDFSAAFKTEFDESIENVEMIPQDIGRVLLNLFNNAFYSVGKKGKTLNGSFAPEVVVKTRREGNRVIVAVKDNGTGIPKQAVDKIFQPFFTTKPTGEGTGLGLSLSYDIITKGHGGDLKLNTKEGEYAEFIIELPLQPVSKK